MVIFSMVFNVILYELAKHPLAIKMAQYAIFIFNRVIS